MTFHEHLKYCFGELDKRGVRMMQVIMFVTEKDRYHSIFEWQNHIRTCRDEFFCSTWEPKLWNKAIGFVQHIHDEEYRSFEPLLPDTDLSELLEEANDSDERISFFDDQGRPLSYELTVKLNPPRPESQTFDSWLANRLEVELQRKEAAEQRIKQAAEREAQRASILAKLSPEEIEILGIK